jgi:hypothetical protein
MRIAVLIVCPLALLAAPALATGGFDCRTTDGSNIGLAGTIPHAISGGVLNARLEIGDRVLETHGPRPEISIGQSWIDEREIRVDLVDPQIERFEARLRVRTDRRGNSVGTLVREGRTHPVRCELE